MHQVVVAQVRLDELLSAIGRLTVPFTDVPPGQDTINPHRDGEPVLACEANGRAYLFEEAGTVFAVCWGLLARVAQELDALVIGSTFDPSEQHCQFFVARGGEIVRAFWHNSRRTTRSYSLGTPLPCEAVCPLSAAGGKGLETALLALGFPLLGYEGNPPLPGERWVTWNGDALVLLETDTLGQQVNDHVRAFPNPAYRPPEPVVRVRRIEVSDSIAGLDG